MVKWRRTRNRDKRLNLTGADSAPDFDPYILPPETRINAYKEPPVEPNNSEDNSETGVLSALRRFQKLIVGRGGDESASERDATAISERADGAEDTNSNVVYHHDGGRFHVPPSYSDIGFSQHEGSNDRTLMDRDLCSDGPE